MPERPKPTVLHYIGAENDRGGIVSVIRALATSDYFRSLLGVSSGFAQLRQPPLPTLTFPRIDADVIGLKTWWRAQAVARAVREWLAQDPTRVFHAHSRAGLLVALRLARAGERRVIASVHCYGRQRWFYRHAARRLGARLFWLSPAMKRYYGVDGDGWEQCIPGCVTERAGGPAPRKPAADGSVRLGGIGMLVEWKGWHRLPEAIAALPPSLGGRVTFHHIGAPDTSDASRAYARQLQARTAALGLEGRVSWLGERADSQAFIETLDCTVVTSRAEPLSMAMLESLRDGVPVLAAGSGGAVDVLRPGETGWFFRTGDVTDLTRAIHDLVTTDALLKVRITPETIRPFTVPVIAQQWADVYARVGRGGETVES